MHIYSIYFFLANLWYSFYIVTFNELYLWLAKGTDGFHLLSIFCQFLLNAFCGQGNKCKQRHVQKIFGRHFAHAKFFLKFYGCAFWGAGFLDN